MPLILRRLWPPYGLDGFGQVLPDRGDFGQVVQQLGPGPERVSSFWEMVYQTSERAFVLSITDTRTATTYIPRSIGPVLKRAARQFPVVVLTGSRQSGKTTLLKHLFARRHRYVSLEPPDVRAAAAADPRGFLAMYGPPVIFDEVQYAPGLLPYIKEQIDVHRGQAGQYLLTGSQNLLMLERVSETLAGRAAILRLLPLSRHETTSRPGASFPWEWTWSSRARAGSFPSR